jgi:hypothetical protein
MHEVKSQTRLGDRHISQPTNCKLRNVSYSEVYVEMWLGAYIMLTENRIESIFFHMLLFTDFKTLYLLH